MSAQATVKYIVNGYTVSGGDPAATPSVPYQIHYAGTLAEVPYWVAMILGVTAELKRTRAAAEQHDVTDPMLNQQAIVTLLTEPGFIVRAEPSLKIGTPSVEEFCADMDAVSAALTKIFTYTPPAG